MGANFYFRISSHEGNFHFTIGYSDIKHSKDLNRPVRGELCGIFKVRCHFCAVNLRWDLLVCTGSLYRTSIWNHEIAHFSKVLHKYVNRIVAEHGCLHQEILLKKEKEILDYPSTKGERGSIAEVHRRGLVHVYQRHPNTQEERLLLSGSLSVPRHMATHCLQQRYTWFTGKGEKKAARRKFQFLSSRVFCSSQKMKAGIFHCTFLVLEERRPKICDFHICVNTAEFFKATAENGLVFLPAFSML